MSRECRCAVFGNHPGRIKDVLDPDGDPFQHSTGLSVSQPTVTFVGMIKRGTTVDPRKGLQGGFNLIETFEYLDQ